MTPQKRENAENAEKRENAENGENAENAKTAKTAKTVPQVHRSRRSRRFSPGQFLNFCCPQRVAGGCKLLSWGAGWGQAGVSSLLPHFLGACCQMLPVFRSHTVCTYTGSLPCCAVPSSKWIAPIPAARTLRRHKEQHASNEADCEALRSLAAKATRNAGVFSRERGF